MKTLISLTLFLLTFQSSAQLAVPNIISHEDFNNIRVAGVSIQQIASTNGQETEVNRLYDSAQLQKSTVIESEESTNSRIHSGSYYVMDKKIRLGFSSNLDVEGGFTKMEALSSEIKVSICGINLSIGDSVEKLSKFHKNEKSQNFVFVPSSDQTRIFAIKYDAATEKITKIIYFVLT